jgi:hypothetical protein
MKFAVAGFAVASATRGVLDYDAWKAKFGFNFNGDEDIARQKIFDANTADIVNQNDLFENGADTWFAAQNQFSALTSAEFKSMYLNFKPSQSITNQTSIPVNHVTYTQPEVGAKDWKVSPVKDQGQCGSCWTFGAVAGMESEVIRQLSRADILSEQQVMDCCGSSNACGGGRADSAYPKLYGKALYTESSYPYTARNGECHSGTDSGVRITSFVKAAGPLKDAAFCSALDTAAQVVAVDAGPWQSYQGGIMTAATDCNLDHQVQATGYGSDFIKVKNSWGSGWGENGFIRIKRTDEGCGPSGILADGAFYPIMSAADGVSV